MAPSSLCLAIVIALCILVVLLFLFKYIYVQRRRNYRRSQVTDSESMPHSTDFGRASLCSGHSSQEKTSGLLVGLLGSPSWETRCPAIRENGFIQFDSKPHSLHQLPALTSRTSCLRPPDSFPVPNTKISSTNLIHRNKNGELCSSEPITLINWQLYLPRPSLVVAPLRGNRRHAISVGVYGSGLSQAIANVPSTNIVDIQTNEVAGYITDSIQIPRAAAVLIPTAMDDDLAKEWMSHGTLMPIPWSIAPASPQIAEPWSPSGINQFQLPNLAGTPHLSAATLSQTRSLSSDTTVIANDPGLHDIPSASASMEPGGNAAPQLRLLSIGNSSLRYLPVLGCDPRVQSSPSTAEEPVPLLDVSMRPSSRPYKPGCGRNPASRPSPLRTMILPPEDPSVDCAATVMQGHTFAVIENSDNLLEFILDLVNETSAWDPDLFVDRNFKTMIDRCRPFSPQDQKVENPAFPTPVSLRPTRGGRHGSFMALEAIPENGVMGFVASRA